MRGVTSSLVAHCPNKSVLGALLGDGGRLAVAGVDDRLARQGEHLGAQAAEERVAVPFEVLPAADAAAEEAVAGQHQPVAVEADAARGVPRRLDDPQRTAPELDRVPL